MFGRRAGVSDSNRATNTARVFPQSVSVVASTNVADSASTRRRREHIQIDPDYFRQLVASNSGFALRNQVVLTIGTESVPLTVEILETQSSIGTVRIGTEAQARFVSATFPTTGTITAYAPSTPANDAAAQSASQYYEYLVDNGSNTNTILGAPHGGNIEANTDTWAGEMKTALDAVGKTCTIWGGRGYSSSAQSSYQKHHLSTVDTDERLNPILNGVYARGFARSIFFHGESGTARIDVGCPSTVNTFADSVVSALQAHPDLAGVTIVRSTGTENDGNDDHNLGNRLAPHFIQLEVTLDVRNDMTKRAAVCSVFATLYTPL